MKRYIVVILLVLLGFPLFCVSNRIAVSDLVIHSDNPKYKYMGKGIAEMIDVELQKSKGIELVEREKRTELLEEMEISLSDMGDSETQVKVGKLLAAGYIIFGEIVDMDKNVLISLRMTDVESGHTVDMLLTTEWLSIQSTLPSMLVPSSLRCYLSSSSIPSRLY